MCVTICGRFDPIEGGVVGYVDLMRAKYTAKWGVHLAGMNFQTRSRANGILSRRKGSVQDCQCRGRVRK
jgi:hypothetical protein